MLSKDAIKKAVQEMDEAQLGGPQLTSLPRAHVQECVNSLCTIGKNKSMWVNERRNRRNEIIDCIGRFFVLLLRYVCCVGLLCLNGQLFSSFSGLKLDASKLNTYVSVD